MTMIPSGAAVIRLHNCIKLSQGPFRRRLPRYQHPFSTPVHSQNHMNVVGHGFQQVHEKLSSIRLSAAGDVLDAVATVP